MSDEGKKEKKIIHGDQQHTDLKQITFIKQKQKEKEKKERKTNTIDIDHQLVFILA